MSGVIYMCKVGDIIVVNNYVGDDGKRIGKHSFIVINDEEGQIMGLDYNLVAIVMSSFKSQEQKKKKLKYKGNIELPLDVMDKENLKKDSYVKADKVFYFDKEKLDYFVLATINDEFMDELIKIILKLAMEGKLEQIINNL